MKRKYCICLILYKEDLDFFEKKSFDCLKRQFFNIDKIILCPQNINLKNYDFDSSFQICRINGNYFNGIKNVNRLMYQDFFYNFFINYEYVLNYQLDAYAFRNNIERWCNYNYDYIAAPFIGYPRIKSENNEKLHKVHCDMYEPYDIGNPNHDGGNSGICLKKVQTFIEICKDIQKNKDKDIIYETWDDCFYTICIKWYNNITQLKYCPRCLEMDFCLNIVHNECKKILNNISNIPCNYVRLPDFIHKPFNDPTFVSKFIL